MERKRKLEPETFAAWSDRAEKRIKQAIWIIAVLVLLFQGALQAPAIRSWLSPTDRLEGTAYARGSG